MIDIKAAPGDCWRYSPLSEMAIEIERRFLVHDAATALADPGLRRSERIIQGYFGQIAGLRVRVRLLTAPCGDARAVLTLKGPRVGLCRVEHGYPLLPDRARALLDRLPSAQKLCKVRYTICRRDGMIWSVDQFEGANAGLVLAEVELSDVGQPIELPSWVGEEVSLNPTFGNSQLARAPIRCLLENS